MRALALELRDLLTPEQIARWECWTGVSGLVYARRRRSSPPVVFHGDTPEDVAKQITEYEEARP